MSGIQNKYVRKVLRTQSGIALIWLYSYPLSFPWPLEVSHKTRCWNLTQLHPFKKRLCHQSSATVYVSGCGFFFFFWLVIQLAILKCCYIATLGSRHLVTCH